MTILIHEYFHFLAHLAKREFVLYFKMVLRFVMCIRFIYNSACLAAHSAAACSILSNQIKRSSK